MEQVITLLVNGKEYRVTVQTNETLLVVIRERLHLTGTKYGCGIGECSACTVLMDGRTVLSCQMLAVSAVGKKIITIEGLENNGKLHPVQEAFIDEGAVQCGFCTPGMVLTGVELVENNPSPSSRDIKEAIRGNLCRCTGYTNIENAIMRSAQKIKQGKNK